MPKKSIVKIAILSIFTIILIGGGVVFFQRLRADKQVYAIDLQKHIPKSAERIIEVRKESELKNVIKQRKLSDVLSSIGGEIDYPFYLVDLSKQADVVVAKLSSSHEINVRNIISKNLFPSYPPQKRQYKTAEVLFFTTKDANEFFICTYFKGVFIATYNYKALQAIVDTDEANSLLSEPFYKEVVPFFKSSSLVYYGKVDSVSMVYSVSQQDSLSLLDGFFDKKFEESKPLELDIRLFPENFEAFQVDKANLSINQSLSGVFKAPYYTFWIDSLSTLSVTRFDLDRYELYDVLNAVEKKISAKDLYRHGYTFGKKYSIYNGSDSFNREVFKSDKLIYFTFKDGYLLYSTDKEVLRKYILKTVISDFKMSEMKDNCDTYFYSRNSSKISPSFLDKLGVDDRFRNGTLTLEVYPEINYQKIEGSVKHF